MRGIRALYLVLAGAALAACTDVEPVTGPSADVSPLPSGAALSAGGGGDIELTGRYVVLARGAELPADVEAMIAGAGGTVVATIPEIGVAIALADDPDFPERAGSLGGIEAVAPDMLVQWTDPQAGRGDVELAFEGGGPSTQSHIGGGAVFTPLQWAPDAIHAPDAWHIGFDGTGVRVAILDGGVWDQHLDLAPNLDVASSTSFVPGTAFNEDLGTFWHGTHVAGIVAASGDVGVVGIAPRATLVGVKVLHGGSGAFEWVLNGIVYAATPLAQGGGGAHIINMSLGATFDLSAWSDNKALRDAIHVLTKAFDRAMRYAYQQGVTVIASAGNGATNFDRAKELLSIPAESHHAISIAATGPHGWQLGASDFERPAYYTDHGKSLVELAAPGGTIGLFLIDGVDEICAVDTPAGLIVQFCEVFDLVLSTIRGGSIASYGWSQGTSMAAPAAAGVAALIIQHNGGHMNPHAVAAALKQASIDHGKPGNDAFYGHGWVNALMAVR